jgi:hypothetical protein
MMMMGVIYQLGAASREGNMIMVLFYLLILIYVFTSRDGILIALEYSDPYTCTITTT